MFVVAQEGNNKLAKQCLDDPEKEVQMQDFKEIGRRDFQIIDDHINGKAKRDHNQGPNYIASAELRHLHYGDQDFEERDHDKSKKKHKNEDKMISKVPPSLM